jgi:hypothetical protein
MTGAPLPSWSGCARVGEAGRRAVYEGMTTHAMEVRQERTSRSMLAVAFAIASILLVTPAAYAATSTSAVHAPAATVQIATSTSTAVSPARATWRQPTCRVYVARILAVGSGGCDGYGGPGLDRMVVKCNGYRGTVVYIYGAWMNRRQS